MNTAAQVHGEGRDVAPEGVGGFSQSWFPVCYSADVANGMAIGREFLDGRIVIMRDESGSPSVLSAYCAHLGVDLRHGVVVEGGLRRPFHHWEYASSGRCRRTGIGDPPAPRATLFRFSTAEKYRVVFAFNGEHASWALPDLHIGEAEAVPYPAPLARIHCDPWKMMANTPDRQHFVLLHGFEFDIEHARRTMQWTENGFSYTMRTRVYDLEFSHLTKADAEVARWIRFVRDYPRAHPAAPFLR